MSLVNALLGAISNPQQQASTNQLGNILGTFQQLSQDSATSPDAMQAAVGIVGKYVQSSLKEKRETDGPAAALDLVKQFSGTQANNMVVSALLSSEQAQSLIGEIASRTGLPAGTIQGFLPTLIPLVLQVLQSGENLDGSNNALLTSFLDSDGDGDVDVSDMMKMASRFL